MRMLTNMQALRTTNTMERIQNANAKTMAKLSSGLAINRAADNASGLAISEKMRAQIRGLDRADRNIQDAKSLMNTADSGLDTITSMMQRMRELAISSLNDTHTERDRKLIQEEFQQLQYAIDDATNHSQWSGMPVIDNHSPAFNKIEGNHVFPKTTAVKIISGLNDDLEVVIDGVSRTLTLPEGDYEPVDVLIDVLDDLLMDIDPNLIAHVTENRTISIQAEDSQSIDYIKGGASFLLYEYTMGNPPGMIIGTTQYKGGEVTIETGISDQLTFYVNDRSLSLTFRAGRYSREEVLRMINEELEKLNVTDVEAVPYGQERIAIMSNKYAITGVGGNMIEIDGVTSILYDNRKSGSIHKTQASISGRKDITDGIDFERGVNDQLRIYIDKQPIDIHFLNELENTASLSKEEIINQIKEALDDQQIEATVSINGAGQLTIQTARYGATGQVIIDSQSTAFDDLFVNYRVTERVINPQNGSNASIQGYPGIEDPITITDENNTLTGKVGTRSFEVTLENKTYTQSELLDALNEGVDKLEFSYPNGVSGGKLALLVQNVETSETISFDDSKLYETLMKGSRIENPNQIKQGETIEVRPPEGVLEAPTYEHKPATATGLSKIQNITITTDNNEITFVRNGKEEKVLLATGTYENAKEFIEKNQVAFQNAGVIASDNGQNQLILTTREAGSSQTLSNFWGSAHGFIMGRTVDSIPDRTASARPARLDGYYRIPDDYQIDETNDTFQFNYTYENDTYEIAIQLDKKTYDTPQALAEAVQSQISAVLQEKGLAEDAIALQVDSFNRLTLSTQGIGEQYQLTDVEGSFFKAAFQRQEMIETPQTARNGMTREEGTYIIGRDVIKDKEFIVNPDVNDTLYIDFTHNQVKTVLQLKLSAGKYASHTELLSEMNKELARELESKGIRADLISAQLGGVPQPHEQGEDFSDKLVFKVNNKEDGLDNSGSYIIDSVRGTAAYTFFYPSQGDPEPSFTVGVTDLSNGATITEGENDTFIFDVDHIEKEIVLPAGDYSADELLETLNGQLNQADAGVIASYFEGKLKLSTTETGQIPIDGIRGNARGTLFYETDTRKDDREWTFQTGANTGDNVKMDKVRTSAKLLRINTIMLDDPARAEKALDRLDAALKIISQERGKVGAYTNRLDHAMNSVRVTGENLSASESLIRDTNIAKELLEKVKNDLLQSASQQMLAHANNNPQKILELLR